MGEARKEIRQSILADLRKQIPAKIRSFEDERDRWIGRYPDLTPQITQRFEPMIGRERKRLEQVEQGIVPENSLADLEALKRELWELFTLLGTVDPDLPIVTIHDKYCADIEAARDRYLQTLKYASALYETARHLTYDAGLSAAMGDYEDAQRLEELERRYGKE